MTCSWRFAHFFRSAVLGGIVFSLSAPAYGQVLFDATKAEMAGNADWVIDADLHNLDVTSGNGSGTIGGSESNPQNIPTQAASKITSSTSETYWTGALSSWAVSLVKDGVAVSTLPYNGAITYGNSSNALDLSHYKVFVLDEPNILFTSAEKTALLNFVSNGGGLFLISDHSGSDRNNDGSDSVEVLNDFLAGSGGANPFGVTINSNDFNISSASVDSSAGDPITHGAAGAVTNFTYHDGATLTISTAANASVKAAVWSNASHSNSNVMVAYGSYGKGRFVVIGDSSPADDGTGDPKDTLQNGWGESGAQNGALITNATLFLAVPEPGTLVLLVMAAVLAGVLQLRRRNVEDRVVLLSQSTVNPSVRAAFFSRASAVRKRWPAGCSWKATSAAASWKASAARRGWTRRSRWALARTAPPG